MAYHKFEDEDEEVQTAPKSVYLMIDDKKHYIDPEIVKKYNLEDVEESFFFREKTP